MSTQLLIFLVMVGATVVQAVVKALREQAAKKKAEEMRLRSQDDALRRGPSTRRDPARGDEMIEIPQGRPATQASESTGDPLADLLRRLPGGTPGTTVPMPSPAPARKPKQTELERARSVGEKRRQVEDARAASYPQAGAQEMKRQPMATRGTPQQSLPREARPVPMPPKQSETTQRRGPVPGQQQRGPAQMTPSQQRPPRQERKRPAQIVTDEMRDDQRHHETQQRMAGVKPDAVGVKVVRGANIGGARMTARDWRRAMILREILDPPLSMREG
jgi:hypothetical protein